jgi:hypothetical protein
VGGGQSAACWLAEGGRALPVMPTGIAVAAPVLADLPAATVANATGANAPAKPAIRPVLPDLGT